MFHMFEIKKERGNAVIQAVTVLCIWRSLNLSKGQKTASQEGHKELSGM